MPRTDDYSWENAEENLSAKDAFCTSDASNISTLISEQTWGPGLQQHSCSAVNIQILIAPNELVVFPAIYVLMSFDSLMPYACAPTPSSAVLCPGWIMNLWLMWAVVGPAALELFFPFGSSSPSAYSPQAITAFKLYKVFDALSSLKMWAKIFFKTVWKKRHDGIQFASFLST